MSVLLPTVSTGLVRMLQLVVLLILANVASAASAHVLVAGFGLIGAFAMMSDSGAVNFVLSRPPADLDRRVFDRAVGFHLALAVAGAVGALILTALTTGTGVVGEVALVLFALAATQAFDSAGRVTRAPALVRHDDARYAAPDFVLFAAKVPILLAAVVTASPLPLLALPVPSLAVLAWTYLANRDALGPASVDSVPRLYRQILEFGFTGFLSAGFSQVPLVVAALALPVADVAALSVIYRVVQSLDLVPATLSLQLMPRVRDRPAGPWRYWALFAAGGAIVAAAIVAFAPVLQLLFGRIELPWGAIVFIAAAFAPKAGNFALVAYLMGVGRIRTRLAITAIAFAVAVPLALAMAATGSVTGLAFGTLLIELLFALIAVIVLRRDRATVA